MGDLVLTQDEVNPVMSALLDNGLEVTALHNHFFWDEPRMFYMHVHGHGTPAELARKVKPALDLIGKGAQPAAPPAARRLRRRRRRSTPRRSRRSSGTQGEQTGAVYKITVGRDDLKLTEMGAPINARMGLNTWAAFVGTNDNAAIAGDVAMLANEVHAGAESAPQERPRRRRDSPPHDRHAARRSTSCTTGAPDRRTSSRPASRRRSINSATPGPRDKRRTCATYFSRRNVALACSVFRLAAVLAGTARAQPPTAAPSCNSSVSSNGSSSQRLRLRHLGKPSSRRRAGRV